jgi:LacI family transcriptional regulator
VADLAGVHLSTASRALDPAQAQRLTPATVDRVAEAATRLGYTPDLLAAGLKRRRTQTVGVVVADFENPFIGPLSRGIGSVLAEHDYITLVAETVEDGARLERVLGHLVQRRVDAIIITAAHTSDGETLTAVAARGMPLVLALRAFPGSSLPTVLHDDFNGASLAAAHLIGLGHRSFAQICGPDDIDIFERRRDGFATRIARDGYSVGTPVEHATGVTTEEGRRLTELLLADGNVPTALFAPSDVMAVGAIDALGEHGLTCPDDVSVVGYNDAPLVDHLSPPLTTIRLDSEGIGRTAGRLALQAIADPGLESDVIRLPATLISRASTAPPGG